MFAHFHHVFNSYVTIEHYQLTNPFHITLYEISVTRSRKPSDGRCIYAMLLLGIRSQATECNRQGENSFFFHLHEKNNPALQSYLLALFLTPCNIYDNLMIVGIFYSSNNTS